MNIKENIIFEANSENMYGAMFGNNIMTDNTLGDILGATQGSITFYKESEEHEFEKGEEIGELRFAALSITDVINNNSLILEMDDVDVDYGVAFCPLYYPKALIDVKIHEDDMCREAHIVYIERLFINEKFRKQGIATQILSSLKELLYRTFNINAAIWVAIIRPDNVTEDDNDIESRPSYKVMKKLLLNCGFLPTNAPRTFAFNASLHDPFDNKVTEKHFSDYIEEDNHNDLDIPKTTKIVKRQDILEKKQKKEGINIS